ncbi:MAG: glycine zipper family protein, partial [Rhodospirillaceae bacterium]|nr:glycine zipper family protein [Rhodospirillaceae bacterium]
MRRRWRLGVSTIVLGGLLALGACATPAPPGPSVMALPARGKTFEQFQQDDAYCQQYAAASVGYRSPGQNANESAAGSAALGTALGAAAGALLGAASGHPATGAAIGAGGGLLLGSAAGAGAAHRSARDTQRLYDMRYLQCMAGHGESVPTTAEGAPYPYPQAYGYAYPPVYA